MTNDFVGQDLIVAGILFMSLFTMKFVDAIIDDGLHTFRGDRQILFSAMIIMAVGTMLYNDFCATWFAGLTLGCLVNGKLDCIEFILAGAIFIGVYLWRSMPWVFDEATKNGFTFNFTDVLFIAIAGGLDELFHDKLSVKDYDDANESRNDVSNSKRKLVSAFINVFLEFRLFSIVAIVPFFLWQNHSIAVLLFMIAQGAGYEIGGLVTDRLLTEKKKGG